MNRKRLGNFGEKIACYYLATKGYKILERNYSKKWIQGPQKGEIDIVVERDKVISFVEVKTAPAPSGTGAVFNPEDRVNFQKQKQLIKLAENWLSEKNISLESKWQIDVVSIRVDLNTKKAKIRHLKNVIAS